jgi:hypothetical protein
MDDLKAHLRALGAEQEAIEREAGGAPPSPEVALALPVPVEARARLSALWRAKAEARDADDAAHAERLGAQGDELIPPGQRALGWTVARARAFLEALAETGSVAAAARAVGRTRLAAYQLRAAAHPAFARAWKQAVRVAWLALRDAAMERAIAGRMVPLYSHGAVTGEQHVFDDRLVMFLLKTRGAHRVTEALSPAAPGEPRVREYVQDGLYDEYAMADFAQSLALFAPGAAPARPRRHRGARSHGLAAAAPARG